VHHLNLTQINYKNPHILLSPEKTKTHVASQSVQIPLARTRTTAKIIREQSHRPDNSSMASPNFKETQVSTKPYRCQYLHLHLLLTVLAYISLQCKKIKITYNSNMKGVIQRYEIVQNAIRPPIKPKANPILTMRYNFLRQTQDLDQDMTDSSSPINNKRGHISLYQPLQQKKTRNAPQTEHDR
jgi:hypothetical protein